MEHPTTSFRAVGMGSTTSHLSWPCLALSEGLGERWWGQIRSGITVCGGRQRGGEGKGKIILFDVIGDWFQLQKYKCQLLHFPKRYSGASVS